MEHYCEALTSSLLNGEALDIRSHATKVREGRYVGRERMVDTKAVELRSLKATVVKNYK